MGRPYHEELQQLAACYAEGVVSREADETFLSDIGFQADAPFLVIGSGGALSAAKFTACIREYYTGKQVRVATPLDILANPALCTNANIIIISASGNNKDIVAAFSCAAAMRPERISVFCTSKTGKIVALCKSISRAKSFVFSMGGKKDGFLALNSILSFALHIVRPCARAYGKPLPSSFAEIFPEISKNISQRADFSQLWKRPQVVVIHGGSTQAAAFDFESKATEAGLIAALVSDHRNFGHGRHHWIAKNEATSGILAFSGEEDRALATATLRAIPAHIPRAHMSFAGDFATVALKSLITTFYLIEYIGQERGYDPGRPGVPDFGSKIYSLGPSLLEKNLPKEDYLESAVHRKLTALSLRAVDRHMVQQHASAILQSLMAAAYSGVALDFDGTLVETNLRFDPIPKHVTDSLHRFLGLGGIVLICTGRGKSAHEALRQTITKKYWKQVGISFYNGATFCGLNEETDACRSLIASTDASNSKTALGALTAAMSMAQEFSPIYTSGIRDTQITFRPVAVQHFPILLNHIQELLSRHPYWHLKCLRSSHSIDVIPQTVSKLHAIQAAQDFFGLDRQLEFMRIGDMGAWPGNDAELLDSQFGLSVDKVSAKLRVGWNFSRKGQSNTLALAAYLDGFRLEKKILRWSPQALKGDL